MRERHGEIPGRIHTYLEEWFVKEVKGGFLQPGEMVGFVNFLIRNKFVLK